MAVKASLNKTSVWNVWASSVSSVSMEGFRKINGKV